MENLHLKNLNIDHTKTKIKYLLNSIKTKDKIIKNFKQLYINDLYNKDYDTEHLTALHKELMILINNNIIKDISTNDY